jgi:hypothetical protein
LQCGMGQRRGSCCSLKACRRALVMQLRQTAWPQDPAGKESLCQHTYKIE